MFFDDPALEFRVTWIGPRGDEAGGAFRDRDREKVVLETPGRHGTEEGGFPPARATSGNYYGVFC
jgi:hypothetical protein